MLDVHYLKESESGQNRAETIELQFKRTREGKHYTLQIRMEITRLNFSGRLSGVLRKKYQRRQSYAGTRYIKIISV